MKTMEELAFELDRVGAAQQCEQLMSVYVSLHMEMRHIEYMQLWAHRPDCKLEMPWGAYEGFEGVERCYLKDHGDRSMPEIQELLKGLLCVHCIGTSVIEVAQDGKTARGVWILSLIHISLMHPNRIRAAGGLSLGRPPAAIPRYISSPFVITISE